MSNPSNAEVLSEILAVKALLTKKDIPAQLFIDYASLGGLLRKANLDPETNQYVGETKPDFAALRKWAVESFQIATHQFFSVLEKKENNGYNPFVRTLDWLQANGFDVVTTTYNSRGIKQDDTFAHENARHFMYNDLTIELTKYVVSGGRHIVILTTNADVSHTLHRLKSSFKDLEITLIASNISEDDIDDRIDAGAAVVPEQATFTNERLTKVATGFLELFDLPVFHKELPKPPFHKPAEAKAGITTVKTRA
jgi:hypothetical protein